MIIHRHVVKHCYIVCHCLLECGISFFHAFSLFSCIWYGIVALFAFIFTALFHHFSLFAGKWYGIVALFLFFFYSIVTLFFIVCRRVVWYCCIVFILFTALLHCFSLFLGMWYGILQLMNICGVVSNAFLIAFTSSFGERYTAEEKLWFVIIFEVRYPYTNQLFLLENILSLSNFDLSDGNEIYI